jgi:hypothetical protein
MGNLSQTVTHTGQFLWEAPVKTATETGKLFTITGTAQLLWGTALTHPWMSGYSLLECTTTGIKVSEKSAASTLKAEAAGFSETSVPACQTVLHYVQQDFRSQYSVP